jgi:Trk-type K+ transport system membrane component
VVPHTYAAGRTTHTTNTVGSQAQNIFVKHFMFVFLAILFISMIEEIPLVVDPNYSLFKVIFEVVSAYGTSHCTTFLFAHAPYVRIL